MAYGGPAGEAGVSESRELTLLFLESFHPFLCEATNRWLPLPLTEQEGGLGQQLLAEADAVVTTAKAARNAILRKWAKDILARLLEDEITHSRAAWFLSGQFGGSARWITWHGGVHGTFQLTPLEFRDSLRLLFLLPPLEPTIGYHRYCDCNVNVDAEPLHVLDCVASLHKYNRRRHDAFVRALVTYITQCLGSQQLQVEVETFLDTGDSTGSRVKADIVVHHGNTRYVLDVTICEPGAPSYRGQGSMTQVCAAASYRETAKRQQYLRVPRLGLQVTPGPRPATRPPLPFIPFAVEATGRLGFAASHFIDWLCKGIHYTARSYFLDRMASVLAKYNVAMLHRSRGSVSYRD